jgi:hypothetical protein
MCTGSRPEEVWMRIERVWLLGGLGGEAYVREARAKGRWRARRENCILNSEM